MTAFDLLVAGGGVQGLSIARAALRAGLRTIVVEARRPGSGASGGLLGALMPHMPSGWGAKKQFQFDALVDIEGLARDLEAETGVATGYERCGRLMPIRTERFRALAEARREASRQAWVRGGRQFAIELLPPDARADWIAPAEAPLGLLWDPLAARIMPRRYVEALATSVRRHGEIREGWAYGHYDMSSGCAIDDRGRERIAVRRVVLACGAATFPLMAPAIQGTLLGGGIKGQSVVLAARLPADRPILYDDGAYVVAHDAGGAAIGSTTEKTWGSPDTVDTLIDPVIAVARRLCPPLGSAAVVERWAGLRPRAYATDPLVGRLAPDGPVYVATGGYKITFGIAHRIADAIVAAVIADGDPDGLPESFLPPAHLAEAEARSLEAR